MDVLNFSLSLSLSLSLSHLHPVSARSDGYLFPYTGRRPLASGPWYDWAKFWGLASVSPQLHKLFRKMVARDHWDRRLRGIGGDVGAVSFSHSRFTGYGQDTSAAATNLLHMAHMMTHLLLTKPIWTNQKRGAMFVELHWRTESKLPSAIRCGQSRKY